MALLVGASKSPRGLQRLMVPGVCLLIAFLGYGSQWLFATATDLAPGPPSPTESWIFNILLGCLWWTYYKACSVDPGHYKFPPPSSDATALVPASSAAKDPDAADADLDPDADIDGETVPTGIDGRRRWCKKCRRPKAPRAHHCRACGRCVPRMDHHCPWTGNCVSLQSFPHFLRFLVFTNASLWALLRLTYQRFAATLWGDASRLPAYLGPSPGQLALLTVIAGTAALVAFALGILLVTTLRAWAFNMTMIETWEHDRHEAVLARRGGADGEDWWREGGDGDEGGRGRATLTDPVEFPYDIGIFSNMAQAMGTSFPLLWFFPFSGAPEIAAYPFVVVESSAEGKKSKKQDGQQQQQQPARPLLVTRRASPAVDTTGWAYEENGLNDREGMWPPVDPEKARNARMWRRRRQELDAALAAEQQQQQQQGQQGSGFYAGDERAAFRARQEQDLLRWRGRGSSHGPSGGGSGTSTAMPMRPGMGVRVGRDGDARWTNADGDQLGDYGVDEDAEFDDGDVEEDMLMDGGGGEGGEGADEDNGWFFGATGGDESGDEDDDDEDGGRRARDEGDEDEDVPLAELIRKIKGESRGPA